MKIETEIPFVITKQDYAPITADIKTHGQTKIGLNIGFHSNRDKINILVYISFEVREQGSGLRKLLIETQHEFVMHFDGKELDEIMLYQVMHKAIIALNDYLAEQARNVEIGTPRAVIQTIEFYSFLYSDILPLWHSRNIHR